MQWRREARKRKHFLELYSCLITKLSSCHRVTLLCCVVHCLISPLLKMPVIKKVRIFNRPTLNTMLFISSLSPISLSLHLVPTQQGQGKAQVMYWLSYTVTSSCSSSVLTDHKNFSTYYIHFICQPAFWSSQTHVVARVWLHIFPGKILYFY